MAKYPSPEEWAQYEFTYEPIKDYPRGEDYTSPAEYRYIELKGYMLTGKGAERFGFKAGWRCMNCYSMVYYDKCPNDECYNFYHYINAKHCKFMKARKWGRLDELGITKEKDA